MTIRNYMAANEYKRIANLSAFNVQGATERHRLNQHAVLYRFPDGSTMCIYTTRGRCDTWHKDWRGTKDDFHLGPLKGAALRINR